MTELTKIIKRKTDANVPHGVKRNIIITLYPGAIIGLREAGRRKGTEVCIEGGTLYVQLVRNKAAGIRLQKAKARAEEKKLRRKLR